VVVITDIAADKAKEILEAEGKTGWGLRVYVAGGGCCGPAYGMDIEETPREEDNVVEKNGLKVFIDNSAAEALKGMQIDFIDDGTNQGFVIKGSTPPTGGCSCSGGACG